MASLILPVGPAIVFIRYDFRWLQPGKTYQGLVIEHEEAREGFVNRALRSFEPDEGSVDIAIRCCWERSEGARFYKQAGTQNE